MPTERVFVLVLDVLYAYTRHAGSYAENMRTVFEVGALVDGHVREVLVQWFLGDLVTEEVALVQEEDERRCLEPLRSRHVAKQLQRLGQPVRLAVLFQCAVVLVQRRQVDNLVQVSETEYASSGGKRTDVTPSKQCNHLRRSERCPPTSTNVNSTSSNVKIVSVIPAKSVSLREEQEGGINSKVNEDGGEPVVRRRE